MRSDEGLTLETSASESLYGGQFVLSTQFIKRDSYTEGPFNDRYTIEALVSDHPGNSKKAELFGSF